MSNAIHRIAFAAALLLATPSFATEIGHVDVESIIRSTSEYAQAKEKVEAYGRTLQKELETEKQAIDTFFETTMQKVQAGALAPAEQAAAEQKLASMQEGLQKKAREADQKLLAKEQEMVKPIYAALDKALQAVAKEKNLDYIINVDATLYAGGPDVSDAVRKKLNAP